MLEYKTYLQFRVYRILDTLSTCGILSFVYPKYLFILFPGLIHMLIRMQRWNE